MSLDTCLLDMFVLYLGLLTLDCNGMRKWDRREMGVGDNEYDSCYLGYLWDSGIVQYTSIHRLIADDNHVK